MECFSFTFASQYNVNILIQKLFFLRVEFCLCFDLNHKRGDEMPALIFQQHQLNTWQKRYRHTTTFNAMCIVRLSFTLSLHRDILVPKYDYNDGIKRIYRQLVIPLALVYAVQSNRQPQTNRMVKIDQTIGARWSFGLFGSLVDSWLRFLAYLGQCVPSVPVRFPQRYAHTSKHTHMQVYTYTRTHGMVTALKTVTFSFILFINNAHKWQWKKWKK